MTPLKAILLRLHWSLGMPLFVPGTEIVQGCPLAGVVTCSCFQSWSTSIMRTMLGARVKKKSLFLTPNEMGGELRHTRTECEPTVTWVDPHTNVTVIILGCLHGSPSSNADLENILIQNRPAALVLELCTTRYLNMVKEKQSWKTNKKSSSILQQKDYNSTIFGGNSRASIVLGIASDFQSSFSGFEPGLEFVCILQPYGYKSSCPLLTNAHWTSNFHFCCHFSALIFSFFSEICHRICS